MKNTPSKPKVLVRTLLSLAFIASASAYAGETGTPSRALASRECDECDANGMTPRDAVNEINKTWGWNLDKACQDCVYDEDTHQTKCTNTNPHHVERCEVIRWSENTGGARAYANCNEYFVNTNGHMNPAGAEIMKDFVAQVVAHDYDPTMGLLHDNDCLKRVMGPKGLMAICPNYDRFDYVKRLQFHEYVLENIVYREDSCADKARSVKGTTSRTLGPFQLEGDMKIRKQNRHDLPACLVDNKTLGTNEGNTKCAVAIYSKALDAYKNPAHETCAPFGTKDGKMYWLSLNPHNETKRVHPHLGLLCDLQYFPGCNDHPLNCHEAIHLPDSVPSTKAKRGKASAKPGAKTAAKKPAKKK